MERGRVRGGRDRRAAAQRWLGRLLVAVLIVAGACSQYGRDDPFANYDPDDPFNDPFFDDSFRSDSINEVWSGPAPSVGWLYEGGDGAEQALGDHSDPFWGEKRTSHDDVLDKDVHEKSFSEKAQEASVATLSILVGAGMTALPFLLGT